MRKQYHFRNGPAGLQAWDVDRLIALTASLAPEQVPLSALGELDEAYWYDAGEAVPTCRSIAAHMELVQASDLAYPIILCPQGRLMDGMHRVVKALLDGRACIRAFRLPILPAPDYVGVDPDALPYD